MPIRTAPLMSALGLLALATPTLLAQANPTTTVTLDSIARSYVTSNRTVGLAAAVVQGDDTLLFRGYGRANVEWNVPMDADAMFEIGSVAKQFAAVAILQLRDAGRLRLDDDIGIWLKEFAPADQRITVRQLLTHTSGIHRFSDSDEWETRFFIPGTPRDSVYRLVSLTPFQFEPGRAQAYSNSGFWLLGLIVERASGMSYEDYIATRIFEPLGMTRTMYCNSLADIPRRAHGYGLQNGAVRRAPMVSYTVVFAPGAVCSTVGDLVTWLRSLHGGKVLSPASYAEMIAPAQLRDGTVLQYGLGIKVGENFRGLRYVGHGGSAPGFRADVTWYPASRTAVVVLMNTAAPNLSGADLSGRLAAAVLLPQRPEAYFTGDASPYVGRYELTRGGNVARAILEVSASPSGLAFSMNGSRAQALPWAGGLVFYAGDNVTLTFRRANGTTGPITEVRRDDPGNHAVFERR